jgi:hypothetical protein
MVGRPLKILDIIVGPEGAAGYLDGVHTSRISLMGVPMLPYLRR